MSTTTEATTPAPATPELSLYQIESEKAILIAFRDECETDEERAAVDAELEKYVRAEVRKVSNIAGLARWLKSMAEQAKAEEERIRAKRSSWERRREYLLNMVLGVMQALELRKVENATDRIRRQNNPPSLLVHDIHALESRFLNVNVKMTAEDWATMTRLARLALGPAVSKDEKLPWPMNITAEVDNAKLKEAIKAAEATRVECPKCDGLGELLIPGPSDTPTEPCPVCKGEKTVPGSIAGARLVQGEHLRVE